MFRVEVLPAGQGDALLLEWGDEARSWRALVDGGPAYTYGRLREHLDGLGRDPHLDLVVVTHIDGDHLEGVVRLLQDREAMGLSVGDVWFNGWPQVECFRTGEPMGPGQGEMLGALLERDDQPWNAAFGGEAVLLPEEGRPPVLDLPGGATATVLAPGPAQLGDLRRNWTKVLRRSGVKPGHAAAALEALAKRPMLRGLGEAMGDKKADDSVANASSIGLLIEYRGQSILLTGDGHSDVLVAGLDRLLADRGEERLAVDAVKLPHHGSSANVTEALLDRLDCARFIFSTNGSYHGHPDAEAVDRVIALHRRIGSPVELLFNYDCATTERWRTRTVSRSASHVTRYPQGGSVLAVDV